MENVGFELGVKERRVIDGESKHEVSEEVCKVK